VGFSLPPLQLPGLTKIKRIFPHVDQISDAPTHQTITLLWERVHNLEERLQQSAATNTLLADRVDTLTVALTAAQATAEAALLAAQTAASGSAEGEGGDALPGGGDGGALWEGIQAAGERGHDTGGLLTAIRAGQIVGGTFKEFSGLTGPVADEEARMVMHVELIERMIWHLKEAGFSAGRQQNPSKAISKDKIVIFVDGVLRAWDIFAGKPPTEPIQIQALEVAPAKLVDSAGIPD
jgi:hypothetical protein